MTDRYERVDDTDPGTLAPVRSPLEPVRPSRGKIIAAVIAAVLTVSIGVGAAFGVDVCGALASVGLSLESCPK